MPPHIWSNLDFEYALRYGNLWQPPRAVQAKMDTWRYLLRCMPGYEEAAIWSHGQARPDDLLVWGEDWRTGATSPSSRLANDRLTLHAIEPLSNQLPFHDLVDSEHKLTSLLASTPHDWIIKHPLGVSGRERITGVAGAIDPRHRTWLERRLEEGDTLVFEPRCAIEEEYSWHVTVRQGGALDVHGRCTLLVDTQGTHRGHIVRKSGLEDDALPEIIVSILTSLYEETGYEGPLSTDGFVGTLPGTEASIDRVVSEINARHTFGRMALELARGCVTTAERELIWWHFTQRELGQDKTLLNRIKALPPYPDSRDMAARQALEPGWYRLPECVDPGAETGTVMCLTGAKQPWDHAHSPFSNVGVSLLTAARLVS